MKSLLTKIKLWYRYKRAWKEWMHAGFITSNYGAYGYLVEERKAKKRCEDAYKEYKAWTERGETHQ